MPERIIQEIIPYRDDSDLRAWRASMRLSQHEAAEWFEVPYYVYRYWETGRFPRDLAVRWLKAMVRMENDK